MSRRRTIVFSLGVVVLIPAMIFALVEGGLRMVGFGHPTGMYVPAGHLDGDYVRTHDQFTFRFFPRALARGVVPHIIPVAKPDGTYRILLFGESAANGDPDAAYGFGRHLEVYLNERFLQTRFEVICVAITAINSHVIREIARDSERLESDLWIVYMGNNEVIGPYGAGTIFGPQAPPHAFVRASIAAKRSRIGQSVQRIAEEGLARAPTTQWEGINLFAQNLLHPQAAGRARVYAHFERNLEAVLQSAHRAGVPVLLSTVASNLRDCAPFASLHRPAMTPPELADWQAAFAHGKSLEAQGEVVAALEQYRAAAAIDGDYAELSFRMARCHEALGDIAAAYLAYTAARDADALAVRADSNLNATVRATALRHRAVHLVDLVAALGPRATGAIPGRNFFFEHVHFNPVGNVEVARIFADSVFEILPAEIRAAATPDWAGPVTSQRRLAITLWDQHRLWTEMAQRQSQPPFTNRLNYEDEIAYCEQRAQRLSAAKNHPINRQLYEEAIAARPDDFFLRTRFGEFLQLNEQLEAALEHFTVAAMRYPDFLAPHQNLGVNLFLLGRHDAARVHFNRVLSINPVYARAQMAISLLDQTEH